MGKYKRATNEDRREKSARKQTEVCVLPAESRPLLLAAAEALDRSAPQDSKHRDKGPAVKLHEFLGAPTLHKQQSALKAFAKALGASAVADQQIQDVVAGLAGVMFNADCSQLSDNVARVLQSIAEPQPGFLAAVFEKPFAAFIRCCIASPDFQQIPVVFALVTMRPFCLGPLMENLWLDILQLVTVLTDMFLSCYTDLKWPAGYVQSECERSLLDTVKVPITLLQVSEVHVRRVLEATEMPKDGAAATEQTLPLDFSAPNATICSYSRCLHRLLCAPDLPRDCAMAAGSAWVKLLSFAGPVSAVSQIFSATICGQDGTKLAEHPWAFMAVDRKSFYSVYWQLNSFSRLSVVRGLLSSIPLQNLCVDLADGKPCLHDQIFEVLISFCNDSADHHLRFHAMNTMHICLQQTIKRAKDGSADRSLMAKKQDSVLNVIWSCLEDPSSGIAGRVQELFDYLLKVKDISVDDPDAYWERLTVKFLDLDWKRKGKYAPLISITKHLGASTMMRLNSNMFRDTIFAIAYDPVASIAASLLEELLKSLAKNVSPEVCLQSCVPAVWEALCSSDGKVQTNALGYALPLFLKRVPNSLPAILDTIRDSTAACSPRTKLWALVAVLRSARATMSLGDTPFAAPCDGGGKTAARDGKTFITYEEMHMALTSSDGEIRLAALELLCVCYKTTMQVVDVEYDLLKVAIPLTFSLDDTGLRSRCRSLLQKMFVRLHQSSRQAVVQAKPDAPEPETVVKMKSFMEWLVGLVTSSICPGVSYERKSMALEIWHQLANLFFETPKARPDKQSKLWHAPHDFKLDFVFSATHTLSLLNAFVDSWETNRIKAYEILMLIPGSTLPGFEQPEQVVGILKWSMSLLGSHREYETNAGARLLKLVFQRYVINSSWAISLFENMTAGPESTSTAESILKFLEDIIAMLRYHIGPGKDVVNLRRDPTRVHGLLLGLHYCIDIVDFRKSMTLEPEIAACSALLSSTMEIAKLVADMALSTIGDKTAYGSGCLPADSRSREGFEDDESGKEQHSTEQMQVVDSWHSCKEMSGILGTIANKVPFPGPRGVLISVDQVTVMGEILMKVLLTTRHNGAIEKSFLAFQVLCKQIARSSLEAIASLNSKWLRRLLDNVLVEEDYALRRSAGIPFCILAILYAEGASGQRPLLKQAMEALIAVAEDSTAATSARVHALNVLRALFKDTELSLDVMAYVASAFIIAIRGVKSHDWGINNSSSMLFAALISRSMGRQSVNDKSARSGVTAVEFFSRFPALHAFAHEILIAAKTDLVVEAKITTQLDSSAFYVLLLLSKMLPSVAAHAHADIDLGVLVSVVQLFGSHRYYRCRCAAAAALAPLVPESSVRNRMCETVAQLQTCSCHNELHGCVLQLQYLLQTCCMNSSTVMSAVALLAPSFSLLETRQTTCVVRYAMLDVLANVAAEMQKLQVLASADQHVLDRMQNALIFCIQGATVDDDAAASLGNLRMRMRAVEIWEVTMGVRHRESICEGSTCPITSEHVSRDTAVVLTMIQDISSGMQVAGLKILKRLLRAGLHDCFDLGLLKDEVFRRGATETRGSVIKNMCSLCLHLQYSMGQDARKMFWQSEWGSNPSAIDNALLMWANVIKLSEEGNDDFAAQCMRFLGMMVAAACSDADATANYMSKISPDKQRMMIARLDPWVEMIVSNSDASKLSTVRGACVDSLEHAKVLLQVAGASESSAPWAPSALLLWAVIISLIQDEIQEIRTAAASLACTFVRPPGQQQEPMASIVYSHTVNYLCDCLMVQKLDENCLAYFYGQLTSQNRIEDANTSTSGAGVNVALFEKEEDNQYADKLFAIEAHAAAVNRWCIATCDASSAGKSSVDLGQVFKTVDSMLIDLQRGCAMITKGSASDASCVVGLGGLSNDTDAFVELYRLSMGVTAFAPMRILGGFGAEAVRSAVEGLSGLSAASSCNPQLRRIADQARRAWTVPIAL